jgi:3-hydroxyacyl-CoA dehydrogenase
MIHIALDLEALAAAGSSCCVHGHVNTPMHACMTHTHACLHDLTQSPVLQNFKQADFVVEAVSEDEQLKRSIFQHLDKVCHTGGLMHTRWLQISVRTQHAA